MICLLILFCNFVLVLGHSPICHVIGERYFLNLIQVYKSSNGVAVVRGFFYPHNIVSLRVTLTGRNITIYQTTVGRIESEKIPYPGTLRSAQWKKLSCQLCRRLVSNFSRLYLTLISGCKKGQVACSNNCRNRGTIKRIYQEEWL